MAILLSTIIGFVFDLFFVNLLYKCGTVILFRIIIMLSFYYVMKQICPESLAKFKSVFTLECVSLFSVAKCRHFQMLRVYFLFVLHVFYAQTVVGEFGEAHVVTSVASVLT